MTSLFLGLYGVYLIAVGIAGNANQLAAFVGEDAKGYAPWILAIVLIALLNESETTKPLVWPFVGLLALNFFLRNADNIGAELKTLMPVTA